MGRRADDGAAVGKRKQTANVELRLFFSLKFREGALVPIGSRGHYTYVLFSCSLAVRCFFGTAHDQKTLLPAPVVAVAFAVSKLVIDVAF